MSEMSVGACVALGAVAGLAVGILVSVTTDIPLAPEAGARRADRLALAPRRCLGKKPVRVARLTEPTPRTTPA
jgi:hypothetical protein